MRDKDSALDLQRQDMSAAFNQLSRGREAEWTAQTEALSKRVVELEASERRLGRENDLMNLKQQEGQALIEALRASLT